MGELVICSAAERDYSEALLWYAERSKEAAERFDAELDDALKTIAANPERFPRCDDRHHFYLLRHFPFRVIYRQQIDHWVVIAVAHAAREPHYWRQR